MSGYPRSPLASTRGIRSVSNGDSVDTISEKVTTKQETKVKVEETHSSDVKDDKKCHKKKDEKDCGTGFSCSWIVWIIVIFIFVLFIVMACFWVFRPGFVTKKGCGTNSDDDDSCGADSCDLDIGRALLYAFVITFFLVLIFGAIWYACGRC